MAGTHAEYQYINLEPFEAASVNARVRVYEA
jgi:hypothetical protein